MVGFALALVVATPVALSRALVVGWLPSMSALVVITAAYWIVAALRSRAPYLLKAALVVGSAFVFAAFEIHDLGLIGFGLPVFVLCAAIAVAFFGTRAGVALSLLCTATIAAAGWAFVSGARLAPAEVSAVLEAPSTWAAAIVGYALIVGVAVAAIGRLQGDLAALVSELHATSDSLGRQATEDELTGLANRRHFLGRARAEMVRIRRYGEPGFLAILDLDHFKRVNDVHGHAAGDEVLRAFAELLSTTSRGPDMPARFGGEEFALLMPSTGEHGAMTVVERIRERWRSSPTVVDGEPIVSTVSIGLTDVRPDDPGIDATLRRADAALYQAKAAGRDRVIFEP